MEFLKTIFESYRVDHESLIDKAQLIRLEGDISRLQTAVNLKDWDLVELILEHKIKQQNKLKGNDELTEH